jgi:hypothetical protein
MVARQSSWNETLLNGRAREAPEDLDEGRQSDPQGWAFRSARFGTEEVLITRILYNEMGRFASADQAEMKL